MNLPQDFITRMQELLKEEFDSFLSGYQNTKSYGLRVNPLKYNKDPKALPFTLTPVPWAKEGFYAVFEEHPGRHPLHESGAYYIQEPSAMSVASLLQAEPGDIVCDLCAAPGGKSTQIAGHLAGKGMLLSNEIYPARAKILSQNIERLGVGNSVVCNESPDRLADHFPLFFQKIVVDAPCSGEGMFRKDEIAIKEWSLNQVQVCRKRQEMILECADRMLQPGGVMVYSTCTFAPEEDEDIIAWFLENHPDYMVEDWKEYLPDNCGLESGQTAFLCKEYDDSILRQIPNTLRLWPHKLSGEGHFAARLRKKGTITDIPDKKRQRKKAPKELADCLAFLNDSLIVSDQEDSASAGIVKDMLSCTDYNRFRFFGDALYFLPEKSFSLDTLKVLRAGLHLGTRKKNRFEPAHALAMMLQENLVKQSHCCTEAEATAFLHGETIPCDASMKSWTLVTYQGVSLGWGKAQNGILKNHYPKGLRIFL